MPDLSELRGKRVVVTGASRGIGAAAARIFAEAGATVTLLARSESAIAALADEIGGKALACDVSDFNAMQAVADAARPDILVNNAGLIEPVGRIAEIAPTDFARVIDVNLTGVFNGMRAALPGMIARGGGVILTIGSGAAYGPMEGWGHYCASKAGALMLTRVAALEAGSGGVRILSLRPGTVRTAMQEAIRESGVNPVSQMTPEQHSPPEWAGLAVAWGCTEAAARFHGEEFYLNDPAIRTALGLPPP